MALQYQTKQGDLLDEIAFNYYGACTSDTLDAVIAANPTLPAMGAVLPAGILVTLPDAAPITPPASAGVALWD